MSIKKENIKDYIQRNTSVTIRSRGNALMVSDLKFDAEFTSARAIVIGTEKYEIRFSGLDTGMILSSCTCPYNYGKVCKHEVAVANAIMDYVDSNNFIPSNIKLEKSKPTHSKTKAYVLPFNDTTDISDDVLRKHATKTGYKERLGWVMEVHEIELKNNNISATISDYTTYGGDRNKYVNIAIKEKELSLTCSCISANKTLCKHQVKILYYLRKETPHMFLSEEKVHKIKEEKLKEYGFTFDTPNVDDYF